MKINALVDQRFGRLRVIRFAYTRQDAGGRYRSYWMCICDCGNTCRIEHYALTRKPHGTRSCGCLFDDTRIKKDMAGMIFDQLTVIKRVPVPAHIRGRNRWATYWLCRCSCGATRIKRQGTLEEGDPSSMSCGHARRRSKHEVVRGSMVGVRFGFLVIQKRTEKPAHRSSRRICCYWTCECDCGAVVTRSTDQLTNRTKPSQSCGLFCPKRGSAAPIVDSHPPIIPAPTVRRTIIRTEKSYVPVGIDASDPFLHYADTGDRP